jgi:hypothetical protein
VSYLLGKRFVVKLLEKDGVCEFDLSGGRPMRLGAAMKHWRLGGRRVEAAAWWEVAGSCLRASLLDRDHRAIHITGIGT